MALDYPGPRLRRFRDLDLLTDDAERGAGGADRGGLPGDLRPGDLRATSIICGRCGGPACRSSSSCTAARTGSTASPGRPPRSCSRPRCRAGSACEGVDALPPEHHTLILAAHAWAHEPLGRLGNLIDVAVTRTRSDDAELAALARRWGCARMWRTTRTAVRAVLEGEGRSAGVALWARHLPAVRERTVFETHAQDLLAPLWGVPPSRAPALVRGAMASTAGRRAPSRGERSCAAPSRRWATRACPARITTSCWMREAWGRTRPRRRSDGPATARRRSSLAGGRRRGDRARDARLHLPGRERGRDACCGARWPRARPATGWPTSSCARTGSIATARRPTPTSSSRRWSSRACSRSEARAPRARPWPAGRRGRAGRHGRERSGRPARRARGGRARGAAAPAVPGELLRRARLVGRARRRRARRAPRGPAGPRPCQHPRPRRARGAGVALAGARRASPRRRRLAAARVRRRARPGRPGRRGGAAPARPAVAVQRPLPRPPARGGARRLAADRDRRRRAVPLRREPAGGRRPHRPASPRGGRRAPCRRLPGAGGGEAALARAPPAGGAPPLAHDRRRRRGASRAGRLGGGRAAAAARAHEPRSRRPLPEDRDGEPGASWRATAARRSTIRCWSRRLGGRGPLRPARAAISTAPGR